MADEPRWDELFSPQSAASTDSADAAARTRTEQLVARHPELPPTRRHLRDDSAVPGRGRGPKRRRLTGLWVLLSVLAVLGAGTTAAYFTFETQIRNVLKGSEPIDYTGQGVAAVTVTITDGQVGGDVAKTLVDSKVTKSYKAFYDLLLKNPDVVFHPGSYALKTEMSAQSALDALRDPASKVLTQVVIPEGTTLPGVLNRLAKLSDATGVTRANLDAAAADLASFGLPPEAPSLEGYLFPATYNFDVGATAKSMLQRMVTEMFSRLDALGVAPADRHRVLTLAALTQKEGGSSNDFFKVARVWQNRLDQGMRLQSDATVSYGSGGTTISTTDAERADASNRYNTYANPGLPIGPISNPGEAAIKATTMPADGPWLYFVLINGKTGETAFSATFAQHQAAVRVWQQWLRDNPGFGG